MRRTHFDLFAPSCPVCARRDGARHRLVVAAIHAGTDEDIEAGILHCSHASCRHEYPIIDFIPVIVPNLRSLMADRGVEFLLRSDLDPDLESLIGDAIGPDSWFDNVRQTQSTYGWDGYADLDPAEMAPPDGPVPGAARRCLAQLLACVAAPAGPTIDLGCGAGRTTFDLAARLGTMPVLGIDINPALLRIARGALSGTVSYPRRRIGLAYDRRRFPVQLAGSHLVDFWACDALALPCGPGTAGLVVALNLLDCVADPIALLRGLTEILRPGGHALIATPFDWSTRATPVQGWIGGHSQRAPDGGKGESRLRALLQPAGFTILDEIESAPWQTRLHERSAVQYRSQLFALLRRDGEKKAVLF